MAAEMVRWRETGVGLILTGTAMLLVSGAACSLSGEDEAQQHAGERKAAASVSKPGGASRLAGLVLGGGFPVARSTVSLWEASAGAPKKLAETKTNERGEFEIGGRRAHGDTSLYLAAVGGEPKSGKGSGNNPAIALMTI